MVLPLFAIQGQSLEGATTLLIGLAVGAYGLSQAIMQIPLGTLSDRWGRKKTIALGLVIFSIGSLVAGLSQTVFGVILGRFLQGAGAISSAIMAFLSDLVREQYRSKSMAFIGVSIGVSFCLALILGPLFAQKLSLSGLFLLTALLSFAGILVLFLLPSVSMATAQSRLDNDRTSEPQFFLDVLKNTQLWRLNVGIFVLHMTLTALFLLIPGRIVEVLSIDVEQHWRVYLPVMIAAFVLMLPAMAYAEAKRKVKQIFVFAVLLLAVGQALIAVFGGGAFGLLFALLCYFLAFNLLEALLPSLVSRVSPAAKKGEAIGVYATCQFLGAFVGGVAAGVVISYAGVTTLLLLLMIATLAWLLFAASMDEPSYAKTQVLSLRRMSESDAVLMADNLLTVPGVHEVTVIAKRGVAYLKIDQDRFDNAMLERVIR